MSIVKIKSGLVVTGLIPRGVWDVATDYNIGDMVSYNGATFVMYLNAAAGVEPSDASYWQIFPRGNDATLNLGDPDTDGSWRLIVTVDGLSMQKRETGSWTEKGLVTP
jgi:hypothetical protein